MRSARLSFAVILAFLAFAAAADPSKTDPRLLHAREKMIGLPIIFEKNEGQYPGRFDYGSRAEGQVFLVSGSGAEIALQREKATSGAKIGLRFVGAKPASTPIAGQAAVTRVNYLYGNDPRNWIVGAETFESVRFPSVYDGIDVVYHGTQQQLEYDFVVAPGARSAQIRLRFDGIERLELTADGDLLLRTNAGVIQHRRPVAYQMRNGERVPVEASYALRGNKEVAFRVASYDRAAELIIDPQLVFSMFFGGIGAEESHAMTLDPSGNVIVVGQVEGTAYLATGGVVQLSNAGGVDGFITKIGATGSSILFTTYLGGIGKDVIRGVAVDGLGNIVIGGETSSPDFPTTPGSLIPSLPNSTSDYASAALHGFVARLNSNGNSFFYSTYLGGNSYAAQDRVLAVATDNTGNAWATGTTQSTTFPITPGAYQPTLTRETLLSGTDGFVTKFNPTGGVIFSTYLGGNGEDRPDAIVADSSGNTFLRTRSYKGLSGINSFPITPGAFRVYGEYYVTKLAASGSSLIYSTGLGGEIFNGRSLLGEPVYGGGLAIDATGAAYVVGFTNMDEYDTTPDAFQPTSPADCHDGFLFKLAPSGNSVLYGTYLGGVTCNDTGFGITHAHAVALDASGNIYVVGMTTNANFPQIDELQPTRNFDGGSVVGQGVPFVMKFTTGGQPVLSSPFGGAGPEEARGVAVHGSQIVLAGQRSSGDFWLKGGLTTRPDNFAGNVFVSKIDPATDPPAFSITSVSPVTEVGFPYLLSVRGSGHVDGTTYKLNGSPVSTFGPDDETHVVLSAPNLPAGSYELEAKTPGGAITTFSPVRYLDFPLCQDVGHALSPSNGPITGGTTVTITGQNFKTGAVVTFDGRPATSVTFLNPNQLSVVAPPNVAGQANVVVTNPDGSFTRTYARCGVFQYDAPIPTITSITPNVLPSQGDTPVTITGTNFVGATVGIPITFSFFPFRDIRVINSTTITAIVDGRAAGPYDVTVRNDGGTVNATLKQGLTFVGTEVITPDHGPTAGGTRVTVKGTGFTPGCQVFFNTFGPAATDVDVIDSETIEFTTPPVSNIGPQVIFIWNADNSFYGYGPAFTFYNETPSFTVTGVSPTSGYDIGGDTITITGTGFVAANFMNVVVGGYPATDLLLVNATTLTAKTPAHALGTVDVIVVKSDAGSPGATLADAFTYTPAPPQPFGVTPSKGVPEGGTFVTISGRSFVPGATVTFGGNPLQNLQVLSSGVITGNTPPHALGPVNVVITNPDTQTSTLTNGFTYGYPGLSLTPVAPTVMPNASQTMTVTLESSQSSDTLVTLVSSNPGLFSMPSNVTVPEGSLTATFVITAGTTPGSASITATLPASMGSTSSVANVTVPAAPLVSSFTPSMGTTGTIVTITGSRFNGATAVAFTGLAAGSFTVNSDTQITATAPSGGITGTICVTTPGPFTGCSSSSFTFPPRVNSFSPGSGGPGQSIVINGVNMHNATAVTFTGDNGVGFTVNGGGTAITVTVPNGAITGPVSVTTPAGTGTSATAFGVTPAVASFSPDRSGIGGQVTITGQRFTGATAVAFNGVAATFTIVNDTTITATVPPAATNGPISVTTPGGVGTSSASFTIVATAAIASFTPTKGTTGTTVTITGSNFTDATAVAFNGVNASFTVQNDNTIVATVPANATNGTISITSALGTGFSSTIFSLPPVLSSFAPSAGGVGTTVTINGGNFLGTSEVKFNGVGASFTVNTNAKITTTVPPGASTGSLTVVTAYGPTSSAFSFSVLAAATPSVSALATSATSVALAWTGTAGHTYQIRRIASKNDNFGTHAIATVTTTSYLDTTASAGVTYLYNILDVTTNTIGNNDYATTIMFLNDPLVQRVTTVKAAHLTELRAAVNAVRVVAALPVTTWAEAAVPGLAIRASHITEMRTKLNEALLALGRFASFTDSSLSANMSIRVAHIQEIREAVK